MGYEFLMNNPEGSLRALDPKLAAKIRQARDERQLRLFACECANVALSRTGYTDPHCHVAVEMSRRYANGEATIAQLENAFNKLSGIVKTANEKSAEVEGARVKLDDSIGDVFQVARAVSSASCCALASALEAAASAAYETSFAFDGGEEVVLALAARMLQERENGVGKDCHVGTDDGHDARRFTGPPAGR